ncbi:MAG TPA: hypothetical protein VMT16_01830 [Thermoanaerobaculia bacterium]|nr:hypothetical protein [Thermoanaerobaculia bacterium]
MQRLAHHLTGSPLGAQELLLAGEAEVEQQQGVAPPRRWRRGLGVDPTRLGSHAPRQVDDPEADDRQLVPRFPDREISGGQPAHRLAAAHHFDRHLDDGDGGLLPEVGTRRWLVGRDPGPGAARMPSSRAQRAAGRHEAPAGGDAGAGLAEQGSHDAVSP